MNTCEVAACTLVAALLVVIEGASAAAAETSHPRLFFTEADLPALRQRIKTPPRAGWWERIRRDADARLATGFSDTKLTEEDRAAWAVPLAFAWLMTGGERYAAKAKEALLHVRGWPNDPRRFYGTTYGRPRAVFQYAVAYDWAANAAADEAERKALGALAPDEYTALLRSSITSESYLASRRISADCALGTLALALPGYDHSAHGKSDDWLRYAVADLFDDPIAGKEQLGRYFDRNIAADGVYQANAYQNEAMYAFPFFISLRRLKGGEYPDYLRTRVRTMFDSNIKLLMPNRLQPTFDCGWMQGFLWHDLLAYLYPNGGEHLWYFQQVPQNRYDVNLWPMMPELNIVFYDPAVQPREPTWTTQFLPESGVAVFRENWSYDANYLLLLAERAPAYSSHENADQTSFLIHAKGAYLAIDPGDGRRYRSQRSVWAEPERWIYSAKGHNLAIVDDADSPEVGPFRETPKDAAFLQNTLDVGGLAYAEATLHYSAADVDTVRGVLFAHGDYFVITGNLTGRKKHRYDWQLHFGSVTRGKLAVGDHAATWQTPNDSGERVELRVLFAAPDDMTIPQHTGPTDYLVRACPLAPQSPFEHAYIKATTHGQNARYLTLLYPRKLSEPEPTLTRLREGEARGLQIRVGERMDGASLVRGLGPAAGSVGELVFASAIGNQLDSFLLRNGTEFRYDGEVRFAASHPVLSALRLSPTGISGCLSGPESYSVGLRTDGEPRAATFAGRELKGTRDAATGLTRFDLSGAGEFKVEVRRPTGGAER